MKNYILGVDSIGKNNLELSSSLEKYNIKILSAEDIQEAIDKINNFHKNIGLIIWSIYTNNNLVFEEIKTLKEMDYCKNIPLIVISNFNNSSFVLKAIRAGASDYIIRPFDKELVVNKVKKILKASSQDNLSINVFVEEEDKLILSLKDILSIQIKGSTRAKYDVFLLMLSLRAINNNIDKYMQNEIIDIIIKILNSKLRKTDFIIKYRYDTVLVILPFTQKENIQFVCNRIKSIIMKNTLLKEKAKGLIITSSYEILTQDYIDKEDLLLNKLRAKLKVYMAFPADV